MAEIAKKVCMCGDPSVGKTSLVRRFVLGRYDDKYKSTLGTVVSKKIVKSPKSKNNVNMMIWDISGQPEFKRIHASAFKNCAGGFAVCDITRPETSIHLNDWIGSLRQHAGEGVPVIVMVNKTDLPEKEDPASASFIKKLELQKIPYFYTSAKTGENVEDCFKLLADVMTTGDGSFMTASPVPTELPSQLFTAGELLDYMAVRFCESLGDEEMGMHMVRKQVSNMNINFKQITKEQAESLIEPFVKVITEFRGENEGRELRADFRKASERCKGC